MYAWLTLDNQWGVSFHSEIILTYNHRFDWSIAKTLIMHKLGNKIINNLHEYIIRCG